MGGRPAPETMARKAMTEGGLRRCAQPLRCPYSSTAPARRIDLWRSALAGVLPGDLALARDLVSDLLAEGVLG